MIAHYLETRAPMTADPAREATAAIRLLDFFGERVVEDVDRQTCAAYVGQRVEQGAATGTARRELETLQAALKLAWKDKQLTAAPFVHLPEKAPPRDRWLSQAEADRLIVAAESLPKGGWHISTFIRIGLMTGTRRTAILQLQWLENTSGGHVDLENGMIYRQSATARRTKKRKPPIRIPEPLIPHLAEQRERTRQYVIEYRGHSISDIRGGLERAGEIAGVPGVTPHVLRHTCCTWLAQDGVPIWEAAGLVGMSANEFQRTYAHHHPDHMGTAQAAIGRRWE